VSGKSVAGEGDAKELVVGDDEDTTKPKIANQISFETFSKFVEPFVRPLAEEDLGLLETTEVGALDIYFLILILLLGTHNCLVALIGRSLPVHDAAPWQALF